MATDQKKRPDEEQSTSTIGFQGSDALTAAQQAKDLYASGYTASQANTQKRENYDNMLATGKPVFNDNGLGAGMENVMNQWLNRGPFKYDMNADVLYQQYKDQYMNAGKIAMNDSIAQAAALTGGYGNSYAATVGNQAYQGYLNKLNDKIPELYQLAENRYNQEGQNLKDSYSLMSDRYNTLYTQYRNDVADYDKELARAYDDWYTTDQNERADFYKNREYASDEYQNLYSNEWNQYLQGIDDARYADEWANTLEQQERKKELEEREWERLLGLDEETRVQQKWENDRKDRLDAEDSKYKEQEYADKKAQQEWENALKEKYLAMDQEEHDAAMKADAIDYTIKQLQADEYKKQIAAGAGTTEKAVEKAYTLMGYKSAAEMHDDLLSRYQTDGYDAVGRFLMGQVNTSGLPIEMMEALLQSIEEEIKESIEFESTGEAAGYIGELGTQYQPPATNGLLFDKMLNDVEKKKKQTSIFK